MRNLAIITGVIDEINESKSQDDYSIGPVLASGLFDEVVLAVPDNEHADTLRDFCKNFDIKFFAGDEGNVLQRISRVLEVYSCDCISRFQLRASWVDMSLVSRSLDCIADGYEYADYAYDVNYAMGCDSFSLEAFEKAKGIVSTLSKDDVQKGVYEFSPWALMQRRDLFNVGLVNVSEVYPMDRAVALRKRLANLIGNKQNMIGSPVDRPASRYLKASEYLNPKWHVAEISCGLGGGAAYLSQHCASLTAYEVDAEYVNFAREEYKDYKVDYIHGGDESIIKKKEKFDCIVSLHTLEHVPDDTAFLAALFEALKPGGRLILEVPRLLMKPLGMPLWPFHEREYQLVEIRTLLDRIGFKIGQELGVSRNEYVDIEFAREAMMFLCRREK